MNCKITEQQTRQIMRLDGDVTLIKYRNIVLNVITTEHAEYVCIYIELELGNGASPRLGF